MLLDGGADMEVKAEVKDTYCVINFDSHCHGVVPLGPSDFAQIEESIEVSLFQRLFFTLLYDCNSQCPD